MTVAEPLSPPPARASAPAGSTECDWYYGGTCGCCNGLPTTALTFRTQGELFEREPFTLRLVPATLGLRTNG